MLTRNSDTYVGLSERVDEPVEAGASYFVSIHINSVDNVPSANGAEVWVPNSSSYRYDVHVEGESLGRSILEKLTELGLSDRGVKTRDGTGDNYYPDGSRGDFYTVIHGSREAGIPGIIVEHLHHEPSDAEKMADDSFLTQLGAADATGIANYLSLEKSPRFVLSASEVNLGESVTYSISWSGSLSGYTFNYVWQYPIGDSAWAEWDSTIKRTGSGTSDTSWSFTPRKAGAYKLHVDISDPSGRSVTLSRELWVERDWEAAYVSAPAEVGLGNSVSYEVVLLDGYENVTYNYAWATGKSGWDDWSSTVKETGAPTADRQGTFTPKRLGVYRVWIDAVNSRGVSHTLDGGVVEVSDRWSLDGVSAPASAKVGRKVSFAAEVSGAWVAGAGLTYNYAWAYGESGWDDWSSTVKETGSMTSAAEARSPRRGRAPTACG